MVAQSSSLVSGRKVSGDCVDQGVLLVVVIPALNEEVTLARVLSTIPSSIEGVEHIKMVVVDDGSTDRTAEVATESGARVVRHSSNLGVGAAFASGLEQALVMGADVIVNMDADGQFQSTDIPALIAPILNDSYGFVTCSRFANSDQLPDMPRIKLWGNRAMCRIVNSITGRHEFTDVSCGFRAYSRETALRLNLFGAFTYTQESFIDLAAKRIAMTEVQLVVRGEREYGKSRVASNLWSYGFRSSVIILRALRDWRPLLFFGSIAILFTFFGIVLLAFVGGWWLINAQTSPWTSLITLGGISIVLGIIFAVLSLIADQVGRNRIIQEQLLYLQRSHRLGELRRSDWR